MTSNPTRRSRVWLCAAVGAIAALPSALPAVAHADTGPLFNPAFNLVFNPAFDSDETNSHSIFVIDARDTVAKPSPTQAYSGGLSTLDGPNASEVFAPDDIIDHLLDPAIPFVDRAELDQVLRHGSGDLAWVDDAEQTLFEAVDLPSAPLPEPGGLLLLATGAVPLLGAIRRRLS
jgi:hypothetical protein